MATLDGLNIIEADEVNSSVITFNNYLNGISPTIFNNISGTTSNIQLQLDNLTSGTYTSSVGFTFNDNSTLGFRVSNTTYDYLDINANTYSNITTPQLNINTGDGGVKFYSYDFTSYPAITLNEKIFEIFTDGASGATDFVRSYIDFYTENQYNVNLTCSNIIQTNIIQRNLNANNSGSCDLFRNATINDEIVIGSNVSTTSLEGQAVNINADITNFNYDVNFIAHIDFTGSVTFDNTTTFNSTAYFNSPIIGSSAGFTSLGADSITIDGANGLNTKKLYLTNTLGTSNEYSEIVMTSINLIFDIKNGGSGNATNIYFKTVNASNLASNTLILENNKITLNNPTTIDGLLSVFNGMTFSSSSSASNAITNLYKIYFDNNYGNEKIIFYNNGSANQNYSMGVLADTLYFNTPNYHAFYVNGIGNTPVLSLTSSGANFTGLIYAPSLQLKGVGSNVFQLGNLLTPNCLNIDYQGVLSTTGKLISSGGIWVNGASGMLMNANNSGTNQNLRISDVDALPSSTGVSNIQIGCNQGQITTGSNNTTLGCVAGPYITTGSSNTAIGYNALYDSNLSSSGGGITGNTCLGAGATVTATNCNYSTCVGWNSKTSKSNSTSLGYNSVATLDNQIMLGTSAETVYCSGNPSGGNTPNTSLVVASNITLGSGSVIPTTGQIGNIIYGSASGMTAGVSGAVNAISSLNLTAGTWILNGQVGFQSNAAVALAIQTYMVSFAKNNSTVGMAQEVKFGNGNNIAYTGYGNVNIGQFFSSSLSQVIQITTATNFTLTLYIVYTGSAQISNIGSYFYGTRIA